MKFGKILSRVMQNNKRQQKENEKFLKLKTKISEVKKVKVSFEEGELL